MEHEGAGKKKAADSINMLMGRFEWRQFRIHIIASIRFIFTMAFYLVEFVFLLNVIECLFGGYGIAPITYLKGLWPVAWFLRGPGMFFQTHSPIKELNQALLMMLHPETAPIKAVGAVIGVIGFGGIFITLLTGAAEHLICGVRTGELLNWIHRFFFQTYVTIFLSLVLFGIFAANADCWLASVYALVGVVLGLLFTLWPCFELVLLAKKREKLALQYYYKQIRPNLRLWWKRFSHWRKGIEEQVPYFTEDARRAMLNVGGYFRDQAKQYHRNFSREMMRLWIDSCWVPFGEGTDFPSAPLEADSGYDTDVLYYTDKRPHRVELVDDVVHVSIEEDESFHYPAAYLSDGQDYIVAHTLLGRDVWAELLPKDTPAERELTIVRQLLNSLEQNAEDKRYLTVLLGFLFYLEDNETSEDKEAALIRRVNKITRYSDTSAPNECVSKTVRADLALALLMILVVAWTQEDADLDHSKTIDLFCRCFHEDLDALKSDRQSAGEDAAEDARRSKWREDKENTTLWYAEWIARQRRGVSLDHYLLRISRMVDALYFFSYIPFNDFSYRKKLLMGLLGKSYILDNDI